MKAGIRRFFGAVYTLEKWMLTIILVVMMAVLLLQVFFRYIVKSPLLWTEELSRFLLIWMGMSGIGYGMRGNLHVKMEVLHNMMPRILQKVIRGLISLLCIAGFALLLPHAVDFVIDQNKMRASAVPITYGAVFVSLCVGAVLLILHCVEDLLELVWEGGD